jgi:hypothetical protein
MKPIIVEGRIPDESPELQRLLRDVAQMVNDLGRRVQSGTGTPEGRIAGLRGDIWQRTDGATATCQYVFEGVDGALTGWVAK